MASYFKLVSKIAVGLGKLTKSELANEFVVNAMKIIDSNPILAHDNLDQQITQAAMSDDQIAKLSAERRARLAADAKKHLEQFESLSEEEKLQAIHDGDIEHYTDENQLLREKLFDDDPEIGKLLDDWWRAATHFIDQDGNNRICREEYAEFHERLFRLVKEQTPGFEIPVEEMQRVLSEDFNGDSGGDGSVDREEFRFSVFQLADQWTCTVDAEEYIQFLTRGYHIVFQDMIDGDKLQCPRSWGDEFSKVKNLVPMPVLRCVDIMTGILNSKFVQDDILRAKQKEVLTLEQYVIDYFRTKHGTGGSLGKQFKAFVLALNDLLEDETNPVYHFSLLFAQMCGYYTKSERIKPFSHEATLFLMQHMEGVLVIARATAKTGISSSQIYEGDVAGKIGIDARSNILISGVLELQACSNYLSKIFKEELNMNEKTPLHKVGLLSLAALSSEVTTSSGANKIVVQSMRFTVLLGIIYSAWSQTIQSHLDEEGVKQHVIEVKRARFNRANIGQVLAVPPPDPSEWESNE